MTENTKLVISGITVVASFLKIIVQSRGQKGKGNIHVSDYKK